MKYKASYYNHYTDFFSDSKIVFNKYFGSITVINNNLADSLIKNDISSIPEMDKESLFESGFIVTTEADEKKNGQELYETSKSSSDKLKITIELTQACNFRCTYCYQNSYRKTKGIDTEAIDQVTKYASDVIRKNKLRNIDTVMLHFIGGEPLLMKTVMIESIEKLAHMTNSLNKNLFVSIDTNGSLLDESIINVCDHVSISMTNKEDHDCNRITKNGSGTYDEILNNISSMKNFFNKYATSLSIRYNVNKYNCSYVKEFYKIISMIGVDDFDFQLVGTVNHPGNESINILSKNELSKFYIDYLQFRIDSKLPVKEFPSPMFKVCRAYIPYNIKLTQDGMLVPCSACGSSERHISELSNDYDKYFEIFAKYTEHNPYNDQECMHCENIGICGGRYFCKDDRSDYCDFLPYNIDDYLHFFCANYSGNESLFEVSNI